MNKQRSKGGGKGTNQYAMKGRSKAPAMAAAHLSTSMASAVTASAQASGGVAAPPAPPSWEPARNSPEYDGPTLECDSCEGSGFHDPEGYHGCRRCDETGQVPDKDWQWGTISEPSESDHLPPPGSEEPQSLAELDEEEAALAELADMQFEALHLEDRQW